MWPPLGEVSPYDRPCWVAGMCIHTHRGQLVELLRSKCRSYDRAYKSSVGKDVYKNDVKVRPLLVVRFACYPILREGEPASSEPPPPQVTPTARR